MADVGTTIPPEAFIREAALTNPTLASWVEDIEALTSILASDPPATWKDAKVREDFKAAIARTRELMLKGAAMAQRLLDSIDGKAVQ